MFYAEDDHEEKEDKELEDGSLDELLDEGDDDEEDEEEGNGLNEFGDPEDDKGWE